VARGQTGERGGENDIGKGTDHSEIFVRTWGGGKKGENRGDMSKSAGFTIPN